MKNQAIFSSKDENKKIKCRLLQFLFGAIRVNSYKQSLAFSDHALSGQLLFNVFAIFCK